MAQAAAHDAALAWTPQLQALISYGLQSTALSAFPRFGKKELTFSSTDEEAAAFFRTLIGSYAAERQKKLILRESATTADPAVDIILSAFAAGFTDQNRLKLASRFHRQSMAAENLLGALLERYLAQELEAHDWIWCAGNSLRAVDFIRSDLSTALQIKNRSNSENSSSAAIRTGTTIQKWYRVNAASGATKWADFPASLPQPLSEAGFHQFIRDYAAASPNAKLSI
ncbi:SinI family restriction endonuclease [Deinococcus psychrotolerans]|uniref:SinI family restriction endonuclease n=1 Tax=Deinococcus psychrotolerans TaxID=2489213 RepID=A0A3G8YFI5_9DEIO|nr:SinI family restriction endonuclease [Deinococcus psychrotolerans]